jgi:hypothetical protein
MIFTIKTETLQRKKLKRTLKVEKALLYMDQQE